MHLLLELYRGEEVLLGLTLLAAGCLLVSSIVACLLRDVIVFSALGAIVVGGAGVFLVCYQGNVKACLCSGSLLLIVGGLSYLSVHSTLWICNLRQKRKERRREAARQMQYTLPERENCYIRTRLQTALQIKGNKGEYAQGESLQKTEKASINFAYARNLLHKLREAPLSTAERLQLEEMTKEFSLYLRKEEWTNEDFCAANELCAALLKISAKYAV